MLFNKDLKLDFERNIKQTKRSKIKKENMRLVDQIENWKKIVKINKISKNSFILGSIL